MKWYIRSEIIENFIKENNFTKIEFCKMCNISLNTLNKVLNNSGNFYLTTIVKIVKIIDIKFSQILGKKE